MKLKEVLIKLESLLDHWGISTSDWILVAGYAYKLLGFDVHVRKGHFNILTNKNKIPWEIKEGIEIHPPRGTSYREDFRDFIAKTGFDFDINLSTEEEFERKVGKIKLYTLPNGTVIRVQKPIGAIEELQKLLSFSTKKGLGAERLQKDIVFVEEIIKILTERGEEKVASRFRELLREYKKTKNKIITRRTLKEPKKLHGVVASYGKAVGHVKVVQKPKDLKKLKEGDVLVTTMTSPRLLVLVPKISALITDWGGKLSHAAILAREMGIPCVVGTQSATKILKDGNLVEVDAKKGVVRIIK